jgi:plasmid maintenance system killer protein
MLKTAKVQSYSFCCVVYYASWMTGALEDLWSLHVTRNRRLTFHVDAVQDEICDVNLEDYH